MRRIFTHILCIIGIILATSIAANAQEDHIRLGMNWMVTGLPGIEHFFADSLHFDLFHVWGNLSTLHEAATTMNSQLIADHTWNDSSYPINIYSRAERMKFEAVRNDGELEQLKHFYFLDSAYGQHYSSSGLTPWTHWEVSGAPDTPHTDVIVLDKNQLFEDSASWYKTWRDPVGTRFKIAVKLQVSGRPPHDTDDAKEILSIVLKARRCTWQYLYNPPYGGYSGPFDTTFTIDAATLSIPWDSMRAANSDQVIFTNGWFTIPPSWCRQSALNGNNFLFTDCNGNISTALLLEVHSKRYVTTRIAWVTIEDEPAHDFLAGLDLDTVTAHGFKASHLHIDSLIAQDAHLVDSATNHQLRFNYIYDECQVSEFAGQQRVNDILKSLNFTGETERGLTEMRRYVAMVQPQSLRPPVSTGRWGGARSAFFDYGPGAGKIICPTSSNPDLIYDSTTARYWKHRNFGYFPFGRYASATYTPANVYDTSTAYQLQAANDTCGPDAYMTDFSFDLYDFARRSVHTEQSSNPNENAFTVGASMQDLISLNPVPGVAAPKQWYSNIFMTGIVAQDNYIYDTASHHGDAAWGVDHVTAPHDTTWRKRSERGGFITGVEPATPQLLSQISGISLALGAKGLLYWFARTTENYGTIHEIGILDSAGGYGQDTGTFYGTDSIPTMNKRNVKWFKGFSDWVHDYTPPLALAQWKGAFIRRYLESSADSQLVGANSFLRLGGDGETRPMHKRFGDTVRTVTDTMPPDLRWVVYGMFEDTLREDTTGKKSFLLLCVNPWVDCRDLSCTFRLDSIDGITMRGERTITSAFNLDSTQSTFWRVIRIDTSHPDTSVIKCNGAVTQHYLPGGMHLFRIEPFCDYADRNAIDTLGICFSNATHIVRHGDEYRAVYIKNHSVYTRKMSDCSVGAEKLVRAGGVVDSPFVSFPDCYYPEEFPLSPPWSFVTHPYPVLPIGGGGSTATHKYFVKPRWAAIAQHRGAASNEDFIVWQEDIFDTAIAAGDTTVYTIRFILGRDMAFTGDTFFLSDPVIVADWQKLPQRTTYETHPSIVANDSGYVVSFNDSSFIQLTAMQGHAGAYKRSHNDDALTADSGIGGTDFPSIGWGTAIATGIPGYVPLTQVA